MRVLFAVSECVPFIKTGGLADVAGSLPKELKSLGTDIRVILPKYKTIDRLYKDRMRKVAEFQVKVGWRNQYCGIEQFKLDDIIYYFIDNEYYFNRENIYGYEDDAERFAFFNRAVLDAIQTLNFYPDIIHCHDWHTGMIPFLYRVEYYKKKDYGSIRTVFTIHNLQFQGVFPKETLGDLFGLDNRFLNPDHLEFYGNINMMKAALVAADKITTVSPSYMEEIQTPYYGEKLEGLLRSRRSDLEGILNGIDYHFYNPETDPVVIPYSKDNWQRKTDNKLILQKAFQLPINAEVPLVSMITRFTKQKGLELVQYVFEEIMKEEVQFVILGNGDKEFEEFFQAMSKRYPNKCKAYVGFNEDLAHKIYAASDLFLMPSKFEPCGLGQMIAMRYGAVPIVRETGGLKDTVKSYNEFTGEGNGFSFQNINAHEMLEAVKRALHVYHSDEWGGIVSAALETECSWSQSAFKYNDLYSRLASRSESHVF